MLHILKSKRKHVAHAEKTILILKHKLEKAGIKIGILTLEDLEVFLSKDETTLKLKNWTPAKKGPIFFRLAEKYKNASYIFSKYLEKKEIAFIDSYHALTRERGKLVQMFLLSLNGINIPKTYYSPIYSLTKIKNAISFLNFPIIVKLSNKERGEGVFLAKNITDLKRLLGENKDEEVILQEFLDNDFDYRILVLGHKTRLGEKRIRTNKKDFRNNVSKGAKEEFLVVDKISPSLKKISEYSSRIMNIQVCGVDVIEARGGLPYVIEVNFAPSFTLDDKLSDELNQLTNYLKEWHEKN